MRAWLPITVFVVGVILGALALILIVTAHSQRQMAVGIVVGLWGLFLAGWVGSSAPWRSPGAAVQQAGANGSVAPPSSADELAQSATQERIVNTLVTQREVEERQQFELRLRAMLRQEVERAVRSEIAQLRGEVAELRSEMVEKVTGQVRLERIETTRLIGSDIEALQNEVRRLAAQQTVEALASTSDREVTTVIPGIANGDVAARVSAGAAEDVDGAGRHSSARPVEPVADALSRLPRLSPWVEEPAPVEEPRSRGGRRRREDNEPNEVLERLLRSR